jgi:hypothetical protein
LDINVNPEAQLMQLASLSGKVQPEQETSHSKQPKPAKYI